VCLQQEDELKRFSPYWQIALSHNPKLQQIHFPIPGFHRFQSKLTFKDQFVAEDSAVISLVTNLQERLKNEENLYIHCWGGHGRTGTIVACLLGI
jgi:protein-tyrosine phosphatase